MNFEYYIENLIWTCKATLDNGVIIMCGKGTYNDMQYNVESSYEGYHEFSLLDGVFDFGRTINKGV